MPPPLGAGGGFAGWVAGRAVGDGRHILNHPGQGRIRLTREGASVLVNPTRDPAIYDLD